MPDLNISLYDRDWSSHLEQYLLHEAQIGDTVWVPNAFMAKTALAHIGILQETREEKLPVVLIRVREEKCNEQAELLDSGALDGTGDAGEEKV